MVVSSSCAAQFATVGLFAAGLVLSFILEYPLLLALVFGLVCFAGYTRYAGYAGKEIFRMVADGLKRISNILIIFVLIGALTGLWRLAGTMPYLINAALTCIDPSFFVLWCFLLCSALSSLLGSSFATVSTIGLTCMLLAQTAGFNTVYAGGAILSGCYVGDRCSPMSSSAALVCALTRTSIYDTIRNMLRTCAIPFMASCLLYVLLAFAESDHTIDLNHAGAFGRYFVFNIWVALPAVVIVLFGICRIDVKIAMITSIAISAGVAYFVQHCTLSEICLSVFAGYQAPAAEISQMNGGGLASMANVIGIVGITSSYSNLFSASRLLDGFESLVGRAAAWIGRFRTTCCVSLLASCLACNQSLAIILTRQLVSRVQSDANELAAYLENSVVLLAAVIPWNIAYSMCANTLQQGADILPFAFYLWLVPLYWALHPSKSRQAA